MRWLVQERPAAPRPPTCSLGSESKKSITILYYVIVYIKEGKVTSSYQSQLVLGRLSAAALLSGKPSVRAAGDDGSLRGDKCWPTRASGDDGRDLMASSLLVSNGGISSSERRGDGCGEPCCPMLPSCLPCWCCLQNASTSSLVSDRFLIRRTKMHKD